MSRDDVYIRNLFLDGVLITNTGTEYSSNRKQELCFFLTTPGVKWMVLLKQNKPELPDGPYICYEKGLMPVYRLQRDEAKAFLAALRPRLGPDRTTPQPFLPLYAASSLFDCTDIATPSRCHEIMTGANRRLRVAVKDIFRLEGLKTSLGNRSRYDVSSRALQALQSSLLQFEAPWNPRGDGYQCSGGPSSGSAAAVATYSWLDCAVGTDTAGGGRHPAMANGIWQFRPSQHLLDLRDMVATYPPFDVPCLFSRELGHLRQLFRSWIPSSAKPTMESGKSYEILYLLEYLPVSNSQQMALIDNFVSDASLCLSATVAKLSIRDLWETNHPVGTPDNVDEYLEEVITETYSYGFYHSNDEFCSVFAELNNASKKKEVYKKWLHEILFLNRETEAVVILPVSNAVPKYCNERAPSPPPAETYSALAGVFLQPILGAPDIVVPIGDVPYHSKFTEEVEYLPVVVNIMGAPGTDYDLLEAVEKIMAASSRPTTVVTGSRMFSTQ
ncbi:amidase signature domain-containing protein [Lasiosphaeria hispida]|uniref:Amidase signature domain-containing protein n=1 Tax=Lasiosphaeria hispida TaxID=260671 RepID=A0AAJ0HJL2_9PEZI|nr:amidase signature domain-containing protein [Lasiosphaeria hispida]